MKIKEIKFEEWTIILLGLILGLFISILLIMHNFNYYKYKTDIRINQLEIQVDSLEVKIDLLNIKLDSLKDVLD